MASLSLRVANFHQVTGASLTVTTSVVVAVSYEQLGNIVTYSIQPTIVRSTREYRRMESSTEQLSYLGNSNTESSNTKKEETRKPLWGPVVDQTMTMMNRMNGRVLYAEKERQLQEAARALSSVHCKKTHHSPLLRYQPSTSGKASTSRQTPSISYASTSSETSSTSHTVICFRMQDSSHASSSSQISQRREIVETPAKPAYDESMMNVDNDDGYD